MMQPLRRAVPPRSVSQLMATEVLDETGQNIGTVSAVWLDQTRGALGFLGVKDRGPAGEIHLVPAINALYDADSGRVVIPYPSDMVQTAPSVSVNEDLAAEKELSTSRYYGLEDSADE